MKKSQGKLCEKPAANCRLKQESFPEPTDNKMKNKKENLKGMRKDELMKKLVLLRENARAVRFKAEGSKSKNVKELSAFKKDIARILTELNNKK